MEENDIITSIIKKNVFIKNLDIKEHDLIEISNCLKYEMQPLGSIVFD